MRMSASLEHADTSRSSLYQNEIVSLQIVKIL